MPFDTERISGYADALQTIETALRRLLEVSGTPAEPGIRVALAVVREARMGAPDYYDYLCNLRDEQEAAWGDYAETETECVPCLAETAPHTCVQPW